MRIRNISAFCAQATAQHASLRQLLLCWWHRRRGPGFLLCSLLSACLCVCGLPLSVWEAINFSRLIRYANYLHRMCTSASSASFTTLLRSLLCLLCPCLPPTPLTPSSLLPLCVAVYLPVCVCSGAPNVPASKFAGSFFSIFFCYFTFSPHSTLLLLLLGVSNYVGVALKATHSLTVVLSLSLSSTIA